MSRLQVVGHVCVDLAPALGSEGVAAPGELVEVGPMRVSVGGAVGNCGRVLSDLGVDVSLSASVGDDELGAVCRTILTARHREVDLRVAPGHATSYSVVIAPPDANRSFWHHTGANDAFAGDCAITATHLLHFGYPSLTPAMCPDDGAPIVRLFDSAHAQGVATSLDLAFVAANSPLRGLDWQMLLRTVLPATDVFCPSWDDLVSCLGLPPEADLDTVAGWADRFVAWGAGVVLLALGERGSVLRVASADRLTSVATCGIDPGAWAGVAVRTPANPPDRIVTTNAAGDTYKAAFLAGLSHGADPGDCLAFAGDVVARHLGGLAVRPPRPRGAEWGAPWTPT